MIDGEVIEHVEFLSRSKIRAQILEVLYQEEKLSRDELRDVIPASRTTIQRNIESLIERGWVKNTNRTYMIAPCGEIVAEGFDACRQKMQAAKQLQPFLEWTSTEVLDIDLEHLTDATVITATENNPYAPVNAHIEAVKEAEQVIGILPSVGRDAVEITSKRAKNGDAEYEVVVKEGCVDVLVSDQMYARHLEDVVGTGRYSIFVFNGDIPYYLGVLDERVQIGVEGDDGIPRALVETDSEPVREWAQEKITWYRQRSKQFRMSDLSCLLAVFGVF